MQTAPHPLLVEAAGLDDPAVAGLVRAAEDELRERYPEDDDLGPQVVALRWLLARRGDDPVGVVAVCPAGPGAGELKRMYVAAGARRTGVARALLVAAEDAARELGLRVLRLETGTRQPEAMALYEACGYDPIEGFGYWAGHPLSRCYEKSL
ncbi:acetyltransferase (GNAT) family protein [Motilibacter peucedani]|uniref:Acetyltransferase (GNAT) family protein n=1 Tax=Motilibacter peucedani TaxID=598650 RepID=A0A420XR50_9ACTN|nr:GNAT family N-acetyltransferase [Motilibacter peucedani]RKS77368.1 acetyltransferase (GNAT) family protein [Motilibacter peucedani]